MSVILLALSALAVLIGLFFTSEATFGVGIIAIGGVLAIWARIAQSTIQHNELKAALKKQEAAALKTDD
jgi:hypothetical protein